MLSEVERIGEEKRGAVAVLGNHRAVPEQHLQGEVTAGCEKRWMMLFMHHLPTLHSHLHSCTPCLEFSMALLSTLDDTTINPLPTIRSALINSTHALL